MNALALLLTIACAVPPPSADDARLLRFADAVRVARDAKTVADQKSAALAFEELLADGFESAEIRFDAGNAWLASGHVGRAIASYEHAHRLRPRDAAIAANLALARQQAAVPAPERSVLDHVVFWQEWLSYREKAYAAVALATLAFVLGAIGSWTGRRAASRAALVVVAITVLFGVGLARDVIEHEFTTTAIVAVPKVDAKKGAAAEFAAAFNEPLHEGTRVNVLEVRDAWIHVELENGLDGWLPREGVAVVGGR